MAILSRPQRSGLAKPQFQFWHILYTQVLAPTMFAIGIGKDPLRRSILIDATSNRSQAPAGACRTAHADS
jgi:hypothetical protein